MKSMLLCFVASMLVFEYPPAMAQESDSTYSAQEVTLDSLKLELKRIGDVYNSFKARTDTTSQFTEADRLEIEKLSETLKRVSEQIRELNESATQLADKAASIYDVENAMVHNGNYKLRKGEVQDRSVKVLNGNAFINGTIEGSLIVVNGDAIVKNDGKVDGDVVVVNGRAHVDSDAEIKGAVIERSGSEFEHRQTLLQKLKLVEHPDIWESPNFIFEHLAANYNRVDGLFLGLGQDKDYFWDGGMSFSPYGFVGYGFAIHRWRYEIGMDKWWGNENRFEVGLEGHSLTDSKDYWILGPKENSLYAILAREDYLDYFSRDGFSIHAAQYYQMNSRITLSYDVDKYSSLSTNTNWSIFGGHKVFRSNPAIAPGWMRSVVVDIQHREYTGQTKRTGWIADLRLEKTVSGDFDFSMLTLEAIRYQPLFSGLQFDVRFRAGTSNGVLPLQRSYEIGGLNTLNAFRVDEFNGNRLLLLNAELLFSPQLFKHSDFFPLNTFSFILFGDVGQVGDANSSDGLMSGWNLMTVHDFKSDFGVGLGSGNGDFRIFVAWRTDIASSPNFGILVARPF